ncbi:MAG: sugar phosphate isomerase/epimerase [Candidatus Theseobacter exili]|nr:sugar phosphate isomerase/epimerase [Candidatus Theseobacter exili]
MFALSTSWNAWRHTSGKEMVEDILSLGFKKIELNFTVSPEIFDQILSIEEDGSIQVTSLHNYCPFPSSKKKRVSPDMFSLSSINEEERLWAVKQTLNTFESALRIGAKAVVVHLGYIKMRSFTRELVSLFIRGKRNTEKYEKLLGKFKSVREKKSDQYFSAVCRSLETILNKIEGSGIGFGIETRFYGNEIPSLEEIGVLLERFEGSSAGYWHDVGHARVKDVLGIDSEDEHLDLYCNKMIGMHFHDVAGIRDHKVPGTGNVDFSKLAPFMKDDLIKVIEVHPPSTAEDIIRGLSVLERCKL